MSVAASTDSYDVPANTSTHGAAWKSWLPAVALAILVHAGVWFTFARWQPVQTMPKLLPPVQISLVSTPAPQETKPPSHPQQRPSPAPERQPALAKEAETLTTPATRNTVPEESAAADANKESAPSEAQEQITPPVYQAAYLNNPPPAYPLAARRRGIEGTVVVRAQIMEDGNCHQVNLSKSSGYEMLDQAALAAVKSWRFIPAQRGSQVVSAWVMVPITFRLSRQNEQTQTL